MTTATHTVYKKLYQIPPQHLLDEEAFYAYNNNADLMMMDGINMAAMNMNDNYTRVKVNTSKQQSNNSNVNHNYINTIPKTQNIARTKYQGPFARLLRDPAESRSCRPAS